MPIVDGLTSAKMIRSYEKTHSNIYSPRAKMNGRIPIIAVSASLIEKDRQQYIDAGFDAWVLKPIPFDRLNKLLAAIVDLDIRKEWLYKPGQWERGGWFHLGELTANEASTKPANETPMSNPSKEAQKAAQSDDPNAGEEGSSDTRDREQKRLADNQEEAKAQPPKEEKEEQPPAENEKQPPPKNEEQPPA
jgi:CheY-like chemotaxis protein